MPDENTVMFLSAVLSENEKMVENLLNNGTNPDVTDSKGRTALMIAAYKGNFDIVRLLVERGASIYIASSDGHTALEIASAKGFDKIAEYLELEKNAASLMIINPSTNKKNTGVDKNKEVNAYNSEFLHSSEPVKKENKKTLSKGADEIYCPHCAAVIKSQAVICVKCGCMVRNDIPQGNSGNFSEQTSPQTVININGNSNQSPNNNYNTHHNSAASYNKNNFNLGEGSIVLFNAYNNHQIIVSNAGLYCFLFGAFYLAYKGIWGHAILAIILGIFTGGISWLIYPFFAHNIIVNHYLERGYKSE
ncbi:MAG: hypothetical protein ACD_59C00015G0002 [uncultured bacterium]|nr:MAG: hypothetical protein ACD_59C00015G0002 [uncultured bacterium]